MLFRPHFPAIMIFLLLSHFYNLFGFCIFFNGLRCFCGQIPKNVPFFSGESPYIHCFWLINWVEYHIPAYKMYFYCILLRNHEKNGSVQFFSMQTALSTCIFHVFERTFCLKYLSGNIP